MTTFYQMEMAAKEKLQVEKAEIERKAKEEKIQQEQEASDLKAKQENEKVRVSEIFYRKKNVVNIYTLKIYIRKC